MKIDHLLENRVLLEGGNLSINGHEAQHLDLKVTDRSFMVPRLNQLLSAIDATYAKIFKEPLWNPQLLASGEFLSGSSLHFFNVKGIDDETFVAKKPTVGDIDTMVDKEKELNLQDFLSGYTNKNIGPAKLLGFQRGNEQFSALFEMTDPPVKVQIDFEFVKFQDGKPTDWARFSHSSSWEDLQAGVKGVFHKWLIQAFTSLTRREFYLRKMVGRGKLRKEEDVLTTDNMFSFAVSSKEGGGLRAKYEPVMNGNKPLMKDGLPVMTAAPTVGYEQDIGQIFSKILGEKLTPQEAKALSTNFWSFTGLLQVMNKLMSPEEKQQVLSGFLDKSIGPGAQGMYKNNPDKDIQEKTTAINAMLKALNMPAPNNLKQMLADYRTAYKMTDESTFRHTSKENVVKQMAKHTLDEATPSYKRKGIQHIYNPGSSTEMKDADFINFAQEIAQDGGKFEGVPINLKVDGAGIRFGKTAQGEPFLMTSRVDEPMTKDNVGDFEIYGRNQGQTDEQLARTKNYDSALNTIVNAKFMKDVPPDTIVQAEMLFNPMAQQEDNGYKFVNIPYDPKKLGKVMTLVPISVKQFSTGETRPDSAKIKQALIKDSNPNIKMINNTLSHKGIDVSKIVNPIVKNSEALMSAVKQRGDTPDKQKAKAILSKARQALSNAIINSPISGKDQLGDMIEGLVINMPSGTLAKVTSPDMQQKMSAKQAMNKKPTEVSNRTKPAVVTIGSFVGHKGHQQLIQHTIDTAKQMGGDPYIFVSPVTNATDDPIPPGDKVRTLRKLYPEYANNIQVWDLQGSPMKKIEKELVLPANSPYNKIILLVGDDRYEGMKNWMDSLEKRMKDPVALAKFGGTQNQVDFETVRTERDPNKGGTGISFTQLRNVLKDPNASEQQKLKTWYNAFDTNTLGADWVEHLMDVTAKNMIQPQQAIKEYIERIKPLLPHASAEQKAKIYESLARAKKKLTEDKEKDSKKNDELFITDPETQQLLAYVQQHYPDAPSKQQAFIRYVQRALKHSEKDDLEQSNQIRQLEKEVAMIKKNISSTQPQSVEEADISRRGILKGLAGAGALGAAGKAGAIAGAFPSPSTREKWAKDAAASNAAEARRQAAIKAKQDAERLKQGTSDIERLNKINYHGGKVTPANASWDGDSDFLDLDGTKYSMASRMPIKGNEPRDMKLISTREGHQVYMWTRNSLKGVVGRYFYPAPADSSQINEFAPGNGDDGLPHAEYQVYQCNPEDQFDWIGGPLYQSDNMGMVHKYAYEMYVKHRPKAFMVWQERSQGSRGNYGVKGQSDHDEDDLNEDYLDEK